MLKRPPSDLDLSSYGYYLHAYSTNLAISTRLSSSNSTQSPQTSWVAFIVQSRLHLSAENSSSLLVGRYDEIS